MIGGDALDGKLVVAYDLNPACADGVDNDADGLRDFPADPGCAGPRGGSESAEPHVPTAPTAPAARWT